MVKTVISENMLYVLELTDCDYDDIGNLHATWKITTYYDQGNREGEKI